MQVLDYMQRTSTSIRSLVGAAGLSIKEDMEVVVIIPQETMRSMMYAARNEFQHNFVLKDNPDHRTSFGILFGGVTYMTKEDYDARYHVGP